MLLKASIRSTERNQFINLMPVVEPLVRQSGVQDGLAVIFCPHTTAAVTLNENADPDVTADIRRKLMSLVPQNNGYEHAEGNSDAHVKSSVLGASETVIISQGRMVMGTWQSLYFCEFDGPRQRTLYIQVMASA
jgi:secondary thiamine-phosphate synthase enzyme